MQMPLVGMLSLILHHPLYCVFHPSWRCVYLKYQWKPSIERDRSSLYSILSSYEMPRAYPALYL
ncbi:hypothetical protein I7I53_10490 [Histoplasma capsulatum var. duboisii H88]|uniref:Uncharacterized protein n=1 Tax=Ajellomyces capsulatus (strain H88) TaxID=544711 RepID=A0A8A1LD65_AJEC8|nr:hypothetical protein I7I53_10490 [Histoplasma capsulatum var. duboisii H88]